MPVDPTVLSKELRDKYCLLGVYVDWFYSHISSSGFTRITNDLIKVQEYVIDLRGDCVSLDDRLHSDLISTDVVVYLGYSYIFDLTDELLVLIDDLLAFLGIISSGQEL